MKRTYFLLVALLVCSVAYAAKITDYDSLGGAPATNDILPMVDVSDTTQSGAGSTKKMTVANLFTSPSIASPTVTGHATMEGVTATGATGTGKFVFDGSPTLTTPTASTSSKVAAAANGAFVLRSTASEEITLDLVGTTTVSVANLAPANSSIKAILCRVTTTITGSTDWAIQVTGGNDFVAIGTATAAQTSLTAGNTVVLVPAAFSDQFNAAATTLTITTTGIALTGKIRVTVVSDNYTAPTS